MPRWLAYMFARWYEARSAVELQRSALHLRRSAILHERSAKIFRHLGASDTAQNAASAIGAALDEAVGDTSWRRPRRRRAGR